MVIDIDIDIIKKAYKKLKSNLYYDKTMSITRDRLVDYEMNGNIEDSLKDLFVRFSSEKSRHDLFKDILESISFFAFPKSFIDDNKDIIQNYILDGVNIKDVQYFIDMDIRGHILGVLWLMLIGYRVDKDIYEHSYGNRIRKKLYNEFSGEITYSPYLFEPYFQQYEGWRDNALDEALKHLHKGQDVVVLTMDFKRFYYSVDITKELMDELFDNVINIEDSTKELRDLNNFIYEVIVKYSKLIKEYDSRRILPIGFLPSNVLANYALRNFDKAILDGWNPVYFGRYVDDVIIVDKIEKNSALFAKSQDEDFDSDDVIGFFMEQCTGWKGLAQEGCEKTGKYALLEKVDGKYVLNKIYNPYKTDSSRILIQDSKVKVFYFKAGESDALITCFKKKISENKSEFRHMPGDDMVFGKEDYNSIYDLKNDESINKFRGIEKISIDKFELSKLLGKYLRIGGLVSDAKESGFERHIKRMFDNKGLVENYGAWEKIIEILVMNESWDNLKDFVKTIMKSISSVEYAKDEKLCEQIKRSLCLYLNACLTKSLSLVWGNEVKDIIGDICKNTNIRKSKFLRRRKGYCSTRMNDKSVMPILVDMLNLSLVFGDSKAINLCDFRQAIEYCKDSLDENYLYYPYLVTMYDLAIVECVRGLVKESSEGFKDYYNSFKRQYDHYIKCNYQIEEDRLEHILRVENISNHFSDKDNCFYAEINNERKDKLKLAIANVRLNHDNFKKVIMDMPNRSYKRYKDLAKVINEAINAKADMLILPEGYLPYEWLATLSRTCAKSNLAVVTGIEHIKKGSSVYNLTAVILPYEDEFSKNAFVSFHLKTHYAPGEKHEINGYRLNAITGSHYELYKWHDCYFPVYCCYEIASIVDRSLFQSYADFLVTIEWNKDINYYSNILESLSRDIHTYCIQVNSSDYGDSRIAKPSKTEDKDIMRTKGGKNSTILVDEIDIKKLREFQFKEYNLQAYDKNFKPTPPGFKPDIVLKKIRGEYLFDETR